MNKIKLVHIVIEDGCVHLNQVDEGIVVKVTNLDADFEDELTHEMLENARKEYEETTDEMFEKPHPTFVP